MSLNNKELIKLLLMNYRDEITKIFCEVDDFCKEFHTDILLARRQSIQGSKKFRNRTGQLSDSEIITIMIDFHLGAHKTFKHYYNQMVITHMSDLFPGVVCYNRFVRLQQRVFVVFALFLKHKMGKCTGISFIDSTTLKVCRNQRIHSHKVFRGVAGRGKSSMGWFYGFKLHLICNEKSGLDKSGKVDIHSLLAIPVKNTLLN